MKGISIHALRVEGDTGGQLFSFCHCISIHALRVEGDANAQRGVSCRKRFLSTPSGWRATAAKKAKAVDMPISIHALRVEGDARFPLHLDIEAVFLSTPSGWRATPGVAVEIADTQFLSTPSGWRATIFSAIMSRKTTDFYPRPPGGGRQQKRTKFSSVFAQKGEEFASLRRGKREFAGGVLKRTNFGF